MQSKRSSLIGIGWFVLSLLVSSVNDILAKYLSSNLPTLEISFFRFFFGTLSLLPIIGFYGISSIKTRRFSIHFIRGFLLVIAISLWTYGLRYSQVTTATIISFTIPMFILIMAPLFLKEYVSNSLWMATILGMIGILITLNPKDVQFNAMSMMFIIAAMIFASLDIINKKYSIKESLLSMIFYSSLVTSLVGMIPLYFQWVKPNGPDILCLILLGICSNLILFCLLKSFRLINASRVAPFRYLELIISIILAYLIFGDIPTQNMYLGSALIIPCALYVESYKEKGCKNK